MHAHTTLERIRHGDMRNHALTKKGYKEQTHTQTYTPKATHAYQSAEEVANRIGHGDVRNHSLTKEGVHTILRAVNELVHEHQVLRRRVLL